MNKYEAFNAMKKSIYSKTNNFWDEVKDIVVKRIKEDSSKGYPETSLSHRDFEGKWILNENEALRLKLELEELGYKVKKEEEDYGGYYFLVRWYK